MKAVEACTIAVYPTNICTTSFYIHVCEHNYAGAGLLAGSTAENHGSPGKKCQGQVHTLNNYENEQVAEQP